MHVIAIVNRKGGSGKTTTAFNLTGALAERGLRVLAVDLDPQGSLSRQGFGVESGELTLSEVFDDRGEGFSKLVQPIDGLERVLVVAGDRELNAIDKGLREMVGREFVLRRGLQELEGLSQHEPRILDFILLDCPPSLGYLTANALVAASWVLIPMDTSPMGREAFLDTMSMVRQAQDGINAQLRVLGILVTNINPRTVFEREVEGLLRQEYEDLVFSTVIPHSIKAKEAMEAQRPYVFYDPAGRHSALAERYRELATEILESCRRAR
jgi:chromosome partitioning protein